MRENGRKYYRFFNEIFMLRIAGLTTGTLFVLLFQNCGQPSNIAKETISSTSAIEHDSQKALLSVQEKYIRESEPYGFGENTTGGGYENLCSVTTHADSGNGSLRSCLEKDGSLTVQFEVTGEIEVKEPIFVKSNKTVDGYGKNITLVSGYNTTFMIREQSNVIISNLFFRRNFGKTSRNAKSGRNLQNACRNPKEPKDVQGCEIVIYIIGSGSDRVHQNEKPSENFWINHNDFLNCTDKCIAVWNGADNVTISGNSFRKSFYAILVGLSGKAKVNAKTAARSHVTVYDNYFFEIRRRSPRAASYSRVHMFNNYLHNWGNEKNDFGADANGGAHLFSEQNIFRASKQGVKDALIVQYKENPNGEPRGLGKVYSKGDLLLRGAEIEVHRSNEVFDPSDYYLYSQVRRKSSIDLARSIRSNSGPLK